jgi:hypothetical protein
MVNLRRGSVFATILLIAIPALRADENPTAKALSQALHHTAARLVRCHLVLATRVLANSGEGSPRTQSVQFFDVWMNGADVQLHEVSARRNDSAVWWTGYAPETEPLTKKTLSTVDWRAVCTRSSGDVRWAEFIRLPDPQKSPYATLYSTSRTVRRVPHLDFFVPLIELDQRWASGPLASGSPVVNEVSGVPFDQWRILGKEQSGGTATVKVEIPRGAPVHFRLKRHPGELTFTGLWTCWFCIKEGFAAQKIETSVRYQYAGKEYPYERAPGMPRMLHYEVTDLGRALNEVWFPMAGYQETYLPAGTDTKPFDADAVVDSLLSQGKFVDHDAYRLDTRREWRVLQLAAVLSISGSIGRTERLCTPWKPGPFVSRANRTMNLGAFSTRSARPSNSWRRTHRLNRGDDRPRKAGLVGTGRSVAWRGAGAPRSARAVGGIPKCARKSAFE